MIVQFEKNEHLLGRSRAIVKQNNIVKKYYWGKDHWDSTKRSVNLMKVFYGDEDFFITEKENEYQYEVHIRYIPHIESKFKSYRENIRNYLELVEIFGLVQTKKDLQWYNLIYRRGDDKPFLLDWDDYIKFKSDKHAYEYYKAELTQKDWWSLYKMTQEEAEEIFEDEWEQVCSRFVR